VGLSNVMGAPFIYPAQKLSQARAKWSKHPFYTSALVLGIDIGFEGIGIYLRQGPKELWGKTVLLELPDAQPLAKRRQKRAWRHCRKNRNLRLKRLKILMEAHGLPWPADEKMGTCGKSDPFILRLRAINQGLGGPEALAICLRHAVTHRGYDYSLGGDSTEGSYPWGESNRAGIAMAWLRTATLDDVTADELRALMPELVWKTRGDLSEEEQQKMEAAYLDLIADRLAFSAEHNIARVLADHAKSDKHTNLRERARGWNFPRSAVEQHIRELVNHPRHQDYLRDAPAFLEALFFKARTKDEKKHAIFHYNRKTRAEMELHWRKKTRKCPYAEPLGLVLDELTSKCAPVSNWTVRRWLLLEFLATRRVMIDVPPPKLKGQAKVKETVPRYPHRPGPGTIAALLQMAAEDHARRVSQDPHAKQVTREAVKAVLETEARAQAGWSTAKLAAGSKDTDANHAYYSQLWDLMCPTAAGLKGTSSLCEASAELLYGHATGLAGGDALPMEDFSPDNIHRRLTALEYYLWKRRPRFEFGSFPQVEKLTGPLPSLQKAYLAKKTATAKGAAVGPVACGGLLARIFRECRENGQLESDVVAPDYCVIEVIGDQPRNKDQKTEILRDHQDRRKKREAAFEKACATDTGVASRRRRIELHRQQSGICPFTGEPLGDALTPDLEIEHLFPQSLGGLSVDENLVLTWKKVNLEKADRTPYDYAKATGRDWQQMVQHTKAMRWNARKRELFSWNAPRKAEEPPQANYPDFGNTTRMSQLARQLKAAVQLWMGIFDDADESTRRIGTPTGWHTAQARKTWLPATPGEIDKNRANQVHHLLDAAVISYLPPGPGMNSADYGGIFYSEKEKVQVAGKDGVGVNTFYRPVTRVIPELLPAGRLEHWRPANSDYVVCPIVKLSSSSKWQSLGDETFWRQVDASKPSVAQRYALDPTKFAASDKLLADLHRMTPLDPIAALLWKKNLPSAKAIGDWLRRVTPATKLAAKENKMIPLEPLRLLDGTPIKRIWKFDGKGSLNSAVGWSAEVAESGALGQLRSLSSKYQRLEIWLGFNGKKGIWEYQKRLIPDSTALKHLKRAGFIWSRNKKHKAPVYMQPKPELPEAEWKTLREIVCPSLHSGSILVGSLSRGDKFRLGLGSDGAVTLAPDPVWSAWFMVSAVIGAGRVEFKALQFKDKSATPFAHLDRDPLSLSPRSADILAGIIGLPPAAKKAAELGLNPPAIPLGHDSSPHPVKRGGRSAPDPRQADLGLQEDRH
jgi:hypothetical protein